MLTNDKDIDYTKKKLIKRLWIICVIICFILIVFASSIFGGQISCLNGGGVLVGFPNFKCIPEGCPLQCDNICTTNSSLYNYRVFLE